MNKEINNSNHNNNLNKIICEFLHNNLLYYSVFIIIAMTSRIYYCYY